ncbi:MAG: dihydropteroate synthase-like protein, partial [Caldiserica bacterium]
LLSLTENTLKLARLLSIPAVVIPQNREGRVPVKAEERVNLLLNYTKKLEKMGYHKYVLDPLLTPIHSGLVESLVAYYLLRNNLPHAPLLMGVSNVVELLDADSPGVNAVLAGVASEVGVDLLYVTEASVKTRGSIKELVSATKLMWLTHKRRQPPKDIGINLLRLKEKKRRSAGMKKEKFKIEFKEVPRSNPTLEHDFFKIWVEEGEIYVAYYHNRVAIKGFKGKDACNLYREILKQVNVSKEHAAYLGMELEKAEIALKLDKSYIQDEKLF